MQYEIAPLCDYWAGEPDMVDGAGGVAFVAKIMQLGNIPESEMQEVKAFTSLPENITYPSITPVLYELFRIIGGNIVQFEKVELWDAYKIDGTITEEVLERNEKIQEGLLHAVAEVFVIH